MTYTRLQYKTLGVLKVDQMKFKLNKRARINTSLIAGFAFIGLAVYGWGLPIETVLHFFLICLAFLALIVALAAGLGWILTALRKRNRAHDEPIE